MWFVLCRPTSSTLVQLRYFLGGAWHQKRETSRGVVSLIPVVLGVSPPGSETKWGAWLRFEWVSSALGLNFVESHAHESLHDRSVFSTPSVASSSRSPKACCLIFAEKLSENQPHPWSHAVSIQILWVCRPIDFFSVKQGTVPVCSSVRKPKYPNSIHRISNEPQRLNVCWSWCKLLSTNQRW